MLKKVYLLSLLVGLCAMPASAADTYISKSTLQKAGLSTLKPISEQKGMEVRGQGGSALTLGMSFVSGMLIDSKTKSYVFGVDTNSAQAGLEVCLVLGVVDPSHITRSSLTLGLDITDSFHGVLVGGAGGGASALVR